METKCFFCGRELKDGNEKQFCRTCSESITEIIQRLNDEIQEYTSKVETLEKFNVRSELDMTKSILSVLVKVRDGK